MHQQLSEASLVELYEWSVPDSRCFGASSAFSSGKIADGLAAKARLAVERASGTTQSIVKCLLGHTVRADLAFESVVDGHGGLQ